jgi:hypothetical protein
MRNMSHLRTRNRPLWMPCVALLLVAHAATAQYDFATSVQRTLELPAHQSLMARIAATDATLEAFATDGCSGGLSSAWRVVADVFADFEATHRSAPPWERCCVTHDQAYHNAGGAQDAAQSFDARLLADDALRYCVIAEGVARRTELADTYGIDEVSVDRAYAAIAEAMFNAVRLGGGPCTGLPWRWGYGYPACLPGL